MDAMRGIGGMSQGPMDIIAQVLKMAQQTMQPGMAMNLNMNFGMDGANFSDGAFERGGANRMPMFGQQQQGAFPMGGFNSGMGMVPGFGGMQQGQQMQQPQQMQQMMQMMMQMMMQLMQMMQQNGLGQQGGQQGGQIPGGMQQQQPIGQNQGQQQPGQVGQQQGPGHHGGQQGQTIELQKGDTFKTPGGVDIAWKDDTVTVKEPGGKEKQVGQTGGGDGWGSSASAAAASGKDGASAAAAATGKGSAAAAAAAGDDASAAASADGTKGTKKDKNSDKTDDKASEWKVWGDPHIKNPDGSSQDFKTKNACFNCKDGTQILMCADKPDGLVNKVRIALPGGQMDMKGIDEKQTSVYDQNNGKFENKGTMDQYQEKFPNAGLNNSPWGNQMFKAA